MIRSGDRLIVRGTTADNGPTKAVEVNGRAAQPLRPNFAEWEATLDVLPAGTRVQAHAVDAAGNREHLGHSRVAVPLQTSARSRP